MSCEKNIFADMDSTSHPEALVSPGLKQNSNDVGWEYGFLCDPKI